jgi:peptidoglycan/LPS O-acetylase OafA/YrhL
MKTDREYSRTPPIMISLSRRECSAMRGIAILGIVLHNYCHWLGMAVKENEYTFSQANVSSLVHAMSNPTWNLPIHLLSFFGHYGVPIFLFLSAYGLTMKYEVGGADDRVWPFIKSHFVKLFSMMIVGFAAFIMVDRMIDRPHHYHLIDVVAQLGLFNNLLQNPDRVIWPGPYWFFGLMLQLYIVYRLFLYKRHWGVTVGLMLVCMLLQVLCSPTGDMLNRLRYNFIGGMLPFGLGLLYGRLSALKPEKFIKWKIKRHAAKIMTETFAAIFLLILIYRWSLDYQSWYWVPAAVCFFCVLLVKISPAEITDLLAWVGGISSAMFVCHPITRKIFIGISRHGDIYTGLLMYVIATFVLSMGFSFILQKRRN